jgi:hypothetical protein
MSNLKEDTANNFKTRDLKLLERQHLKDQTGLHHSLEITRADKFNRCMHSPYCRPFKIQTPVSSEHRTICCVSRNSFSATCPYIQFQRPTQSLHAFAIQMLPPTLT